MSQTEKSNPDALSEETAVSKKTAPDEETTASEETVADEQQAPQDTTGEGEERFDFVVPKESYKHHQKKRRHKKRKKDAPKSTSEEQMEESYDDFVFATPGKKKHKHHKHHKHRKKWPLWLKIIIIIVSVILVLAIVLTSTYFILKEIGRKAMHNYDNINIEIPLDDDDGDVGILQKGRTVRYGGKTYRLNEDIMTVTFIGYKESEGAEDGSFMADAIYIAAIDDYTGKTTILGVSRDTMLDVDVYSAEGEFIDTETKQLSYAFSYNNDTVKGGENLNLSLTRLFFGLPFENYFALDLEALEELNDAIGGVTLTSKLTFNSSYYGRTVEEGEEITLHGRDAVKYVQSREYDDLEGNNARMDRQQQYIKAFLSSIIPAAKKDISTVTTLFGVVSEHSDSTLDLPKVTYLATAALSKMRSASQIEYVSLTGKIKAGEPAEMYLDNKDVLDTMLRVFYTPVP